ncbi:MAG: SUMF1/EgtB/PvdO family nonheme iron enzyme [Nitrospirota bacterium]
MKEGPILSALGIVMIFMVISAIMRTREVRHDAKSARLRQSGVVKVIPVDPNRFNHLKIAQVGRVPSPMVFIEASSVIRGTESELGQFDERPMRNVTLSPYWIDLTEVNNQQYQKFSEKTGRPKQEVMIFFDDESVLYAPNLPAVGVTWFDAQAFCGWNGKRLPTEAEWEYAAGGNSLGGWPWNATFEEGYANLRGEEDGFAYTSPVGSYEAGRSPFGLYDMSGNVEEWVLDWYDEFFYKEGQVTLPMGPDTGKTRVVRGGSWESTQNNARNTRRHSVFPHRKEAGIGFRCVMDNPSAL